MRAGLLDSLSSFAELEARISSMQGNKARGDAFEVFAEAYLATQKIALAKEVWPFESIPLEQRKALSLDTGRDMGVDGTYLTIDGELRAYQVKFRSNRPSLTWDELSTFMGLTDQVSQRVLFTNCEALPNLMQDRSGFVAIRGSDLDRLTAEDFEAMRQWLNSGRITLPHKQPFPHQQEALTNIARGLDENDRATVVMACGTGKSLVALWAAEQRKDKALLVLVPSLALVRQLLHEWLRETKWEDLTFICVCSDPTVTKGVDELIVHQADLDFPVTTESAIVKQFLSKPFDGTKIVFSTYQSAPVVAAGMPVSAHGVAQPFDLGIFDEAHKTASRDGTRFSFALDDTNLPIRKRLFFTATPRHYDIRKKDKEGDSTLVYSMDKPEVYGPVVHTLSFAEAARRNIISDYKVVISVVTSAMVNDHLLQHGEVIVDGDVVKARQVALQIALQKAVEKYGVSRIFTFHGTVAAARSFTSDDGEGIHQHLSDFATLHVSGAMPTSQRESHMKAFRQAERAVMSNARCLTEGVDVPAVDMVAFISPRKSKVDIVQATGRAMRKSPGKEFGYVMVPLFVEQAENESIEDALKRTGFDDIWDLLGAMKEQDDVLTDIIRQMREDRGRTGGYDESRFEELVEVLGPSVSLSTIRQSIAADCVESFGASWDERYGELLAFNRDHGHTRVPLIGISSLANWVSVQRRNHKTGKLSLDKVRRLTEIKFDWNPENTDWEANFDALLAYVNEKGNSRVPQSYKTDQGVYLGVWVSTQRGNKNSIEHSRRIKLEALPGWTWNRLEQAWEDQYLLLKEFAERTGHTRVPRGFTTPDGHRLDVWVLKERMNKESMPITRRQKLESLPGWTWDALSDKWERGFRYLQEFAKMTGNCLVGNKYKTEDGFALGTWVANLRINVESIPADRKIRLEGLPGWSWDVLSNNWETGYGHLVKFLDRAGHCKVISTYETADGFKLGQWVYVQRRNRNSVPTERRLKLETLPGWVWSSNDALWDEGYRHIAEFAEREKHCQVAAKYRTVDGYLLGSWVANQRTKKDQLSDERRERLEALNGWMWSVSTDRWEVGYRYLKDFNDREGHCRIPQAHSTNDGYLLGLWVANQRAKKDRISIQRKCRLEALPGWTWDVNTGRWEIGFCYLSEFARDEKHCRVPATHRTSDNYPLGAWVRSQRAGKNSLSTERRMRLEALQDWIW